MDGGQWTQASRNGYNLRDAVARCTTQVTLKRTKNQRIRSNLFSGKEHELISHMITELYSL